MRKRWLPVALLALGIFAVNGVVRFITWKAKIVSETEQVTMGMVAVAIVAVGLIVVSAWWAVRYPFSRLVFDIGAAVGVGGLLSVIIGPFLGGSKPFAGGLESFVGQLLLFLGLAAVGVVLGFLAMVALGKDWKSRGLKRYEQTYSRKPPRTARG